MEKNKEHVVNMAAGIFNLMVSIAIGFFLSPYIARNIGNEANGYMSLANTFISYASLISTALNSMGSRFIMMSYYKNDAKKANIYYSSLFFGNMGLSILFLLIAILGVANLDSLINISPEYVNDVKILFLLLFTNFIISTFVTVWSTAPYIKNKLYLNSLKNITGTLLRGLIILIAFAIFVPKIYYLALGTLIGGIIAAGMGIYYKLKLLPELKIKRCDFSFKAVKTVVSSGIWNSISSLSSILVVGMDVLIANLLINPDAMGVMAVSKTMPEYISTLNSTLAAVFVPTLIMDFAQDNIQDITATIFKSAKIIAVICSLPLGFLIVYGWDFYALWQPTYDTDMLYILSLITIFGRVFFTGMQPLYNVFTVTNKVRQNAIVMIINALASFGITLLFVKYTSLGVFAIAGVSVVCCFIKNMVFVIPFAAKYVGLKWYTFYKTVWVSIVCCITLVVIGFLLKWIIPHDGWLMLIVSGIVFCIVGLFATSMIVLNKTERKYLFGRVFAKLKHKKDEIE